MVYFFWFSGMWKLGPYRTKLSLPLTHTSLVDKGLYTVACK